MDKLMQVYDQYGPSVWRCVLEFSFLLHTMIDIDNLFTPVFDRLERDVKARPELANDVVNEINWFARSPYDLTARLLALTLERLSKCGNVLADLISNQEADWLLRLAAANAAITSRSQSTYSSVLRLFKEASQEKSLETFRRIVLPLAESFANTGTPGLQFAIQCFETNELGQHGPLLLSLFGVDFASWFLAHPPRPSKRWAAVLLLSWRKVKESVLRDALLTTLIDSWCTNSKIAAFVRRKLRDEIRGNPAYLSPANIHLKARVLAFAVPESGSAGHSYNEGLMRILRSTDEEWKNNKDSVLLDRETGKRAARGIAQLPTQFHLRVLEWVDANPQSMRFQRQFFAEMMRPSTFRLLSQECQVVFLQLKSLPDHVTTGEIDVLLMDNAIADEQIRSLFRDLMVVILRRSRLSTPEIGSSLSEHE